MVASGESFAIIEAWQGGAQYNKYLRTATDYAWAAGMKVKKKTETET